MKLLVVDDDIRIRKMIAAMISGPRDEVFECEDGNQALTSYREHQPDWVLMDLKMPGVDGIAATRMIKSFYPEARIVIVTTYESAAIRETAEKAGACAFVLKDDLSALRRIIVSR